MLEAVPDRIDAVFGEVPLVAVVPAVVAGTGLGFGVSVVLGFECGIPNKKPIMPPKAKLAKAMIVVIPNMDKKKLNFVACPME